MMAGGALVALFGVILLGVHLDRRGADPGRHDRRRLEGVTGIAPRGQGRPGALYTIWILLKVRPTAPPPLTVAN